MRIGVFGGGFKPFTTGHFSKLALALQENDLVILFYALSERKKGADFVYTKEMAREIYDIVKVALEREYGNRIRVMIGNPTPILKIFSLIDAIRFARDNDNINLYALGIDPDSVESLTIYSDPEDLKRFTSYIGGEKEDRYYGNMISSGRLRFDSGLTDEPGDLSRMIVAMKDVYPTMTDEELHDLISVRGSDVRQFISVKDRLRIERYLPDFLDDREKDSIVAILMRGIVSENVLRDFIVAVMRG